MKIKTRNGEIITGKEAYHRWKEAIKNMSPYDQSKILYNNTWFIIIGILGGLIVSFFAITRLWWLIIVLSGAFFNSLVQQVGNYQRMIQLKETQKLLDEMKGGLKEDDIKEILA